MNKDIAAKWFDATWGENFDPSIVDELAAPDVVMQYPLHGRLEGPKAIKEMLYRLRTAFPDLKFWIVGEVIAEGEYVFGRWEGGGTHTGPAFSDLPAGSLPKNSGKTVHFTGMTIFRIVDGAVVEEIGEEDALRAGLQLGIIRTS